jgi:hypothetical protein
MRRGLPAAISKALAAAPANNISVD